MHFRSKKRHKSDPKLSVESELMPIQSNEQRLLVIKLDCISDWSIVIDLGKKSGESPSDSIESHWSPPVALQIRRGRTGGWRRSTQSTRLAADWAGPSEDGRQRFSEPGHLAASQGTRLNVGMDQYLLILWCWDVAISIRSINIYFLEKNKKKIGFRNRKKIGFQNSNRKKKDCQTKMNHSFKFGNNTNTKHKQSLPHFMRNVTVDICGSTANLRMVLHLYM